MIVAMLALGAALFGLFLIGEWRWVKLPLLPSMLSIHVDPSSYADCCPSALI